MVRALLTNVAANAVIDLGNATLFVGDNQETRQPCVIAGGGGKVLKLGRYLRLRNINGDARVPHNKLLTSILHAVGITDVEFFGERTVATRADYQGPLLPLMV